MSFYWEGLLDMGQNPDSQAMWANISNPLEFIW